jgi:hypothetical protein
MAAEEARAAGDQCRTKSQVTSIKGQNSKALASPL